MDENQENILLGDNSSVRPVTSGGRKKAEALFVGDGPNQADAANKSSLQANFMKFREQKIRERQIMKLCQQTNAENKRNQEFKDELRNKFIDTAKKYLGVPYALRYKNPEDPVAPLYLDCCGLVRQVVQDLKEDFGFIIGKWNQAYQMDTLPIVLKEEDLKPGDLIFYEGAYNSKRSKPQKHNNVHVEIFLGGETGEATIGSRYHRGKVSIFPSYKFKSTTWDLIQYHYRSIDTWLDGVCKSCCPEHAWQSDALSHVDVAGKRSIFSDENFADDVAAGGDEDLDLETEQGGGDCENDHDCSELPLAIIHTSTSAADSSIETNELIESALPPQPFSDLLKPTSSVETCNKQMPLKRGKRISPYANNPTSVKEESNNKSAGDKRSVRSSALRDSKEKDKDVARSYYVGKSNGWRLVKAALDKRGWQQLPFEYQFSSRYGLKWVERRSQIDYRAHQPGQLVCHIPNNDVITTKLGLLTTLRDKFCKKLPGSTQMVHPPWLPETYDLDSPADIAFLLKETEEILSLTSKDPVWIYKPSCNNRGRGIKVVAGLENLKLICHGKNTGDPDTSIPPLKGIVQKYLENPLLIGPEGYKFDIRCYMLVACNFPTTIAFYHPGYCRLALKPYSLHASDGSTLDDTMMHLTNASIQKKDPLYQSNKDIQIQSLSSVADQMESCGKFSSAEYIRNGLDHDIKRCMVDVLKAGNAKLLKKHGYFDLLGCDFMLSDDNQLYLLEINTNPALSLDNSVLENLLPGVVDGAIELVLETQGPDLDSSTQDRNFVTKTLPFQFQPVFDEASGWFYGK